MYYVLSAVLLRISVLTRSLGLGLGIDRSGEISRPSQIFETNKIRRGFRGWLWESEDLEGSLDKVKFF